MQPGSNFLSQKTKKCTFARFIHRFLRNVHFLQWLNGWSGIRKIDKIILKICSCLLIFLQWETSSLKVKYWVRYVKICVKTPILMAFHKSVFVCYVMWSKRHKSLVPRQKISAIFECKRYWNICSLCKKRTGDPLLSACRIVTQTDASDVFTGTTFDRSIGLSKLCRSWFCQSSGCCCTAN